MKFTGNYWGARSMGPQINEPHGETLFSSVPPSYSLVSDPWMAFWADTVLFKGPQPRLLRCFQNCRDTRSLIGVFAPLVGQWAKRIFLGDSWPNEFQKIKIFGMGQNLSGVVISANLGRISQHEFHNKEYCFFVTKPDAQEWFLFLHCHCLLTLAGLPAGLLVLP